MNFRRGLLYTGDDEPEWTQWRR